MYSKNKDIISGTFFLLLSLVIFISSFSIKKVTNVNIGSAFVPQIVSILMAIVSITVIYGGYKEVKELKGITINKEANRNTVKTWAVVATFVMIGVYVAVLDTLGFIIATSIYLFVQFCILADKETRKIPMFAIVSIATSGIVYFIFVRVFQLLLPTGILG